MTDVRMTDWRIFTADATPHDGLTELPPPPPWRKSSVAASPTQPERPPFDLEADKLRGEPIRLADHVVRAVNAALYLRRPLLVTGKPGVGKSSLAYAVAYQLRMGPVLKWPITSRATVKSGLYDYDAVGRLQDDEKAELGQYFRLGPLGTALYPTSWPRVLLIDEIDKGDLDLPNDLLNVLEDGVFEIPELARAKQVDTAVKTHGSDELATIKRGVVKCQQFPFIVMTSNGEREFPAPFLRRCIRITIPQPLFPELKEIVLAHIRANVAAAPPGSLDRMINEFLRLRETQDLATDQLLNAAFLVLGDGRSQLRDGEVPEGDETLETFRLLVKQLSTTESL
jgi:MoxR-like ATPase